MTKEPRVSIIDIINPALGILNRAAMGNNNCQEKVDSDCPRCETPPGHVGKARDVFLAAENVMPVTFTGVRAHFMTKVSRLERNLRWSVTNLFKLNYGGGGSKPGAFWMSSACYVQRAMGCASIMSEVDPFSGNLNFEAFGRTAGDRVHAAVTTQVIGWKQPAIARLDLDYMCPTRTVSFSMDPYVQDCTFEYIQAFSNRLSIGAELSFSKKSNFGGPESPSTKIRPAAIVKYTGSDYVLSAKVNPIAGAVKGAYYRHVTDAVHAGTTIELDRSRSVAVTRFGVRVKSDSSVWRASIGTDSVVNSTWERMFTNRVSAVVSAFVNQAHNIWGLGIGVSFE